MADLTLLMITQAFPYDPPGESFVAAELEVLTRHFARVYVMPISGSSRDRVALPEGAELIDDALEIVQASKRSPVLLLKSLRLALGMLCRELAQQRRYILQQPSQGVILVKNALWAGAAAQAVGAFCQAHAPSIVVAWWLNLPAAAAILARDGYKLHQPVVTRAHRYDIYAETHTPPICHFQQYLVERVDQILPISKHGADYLKQKYPAQSAKIGLARLGVPGGSNGKPSQDGIFRIVSCSGISPVKRLVLIAQALAQIDARVHWTHFGDGPERPALEHLLARLASMPNISVTLAGWTPNDQVLCHYENEPVDLFVNVSSSEGIPVAILEAMSRGIPALATAVGGTAELINAAAGAGWLLPADLTPQHLAQEITNAITVLSDETRRDAIRGAAIEAWRTAFHSEQNFVAYANLLKQWIAKASAKVEGLSPN